MPAPCDPAQAALNHRSWPEPTRSPHDPDELDAFGAKRGYPAAAKMQGIPPAIDTDNEDVAWGLQTAEALWRRGERVDAIVWLRRAAQGAAEAADDDRALQLARSAAELCDWMAALPAGTSDVPVALSSPPPPLATPLAEDERPTLAPSAPVDADASPHSESVPPGEAVHAGLFDPWSDRPSPVAATTAAPDPGDEEVVTSLRPERVEQQLQQQRVNVLAAVLTGDLPQSQTELSPSPARVAWVEESPDESQSQSPPLAKIAPRPPPLPPRATKSQVPRPTLSPRPSARPPEGIPAPVVSRPPPPVPRADTPARVVLDDVEAFADLPDDARLAFASAARVTELAEGEEVSSFALAYIVSGSVDVAATMVDAPAARLHSGAVLRSRGTIEDGIPTRLIGVRSGVVATWTHAAVEEAFRTCPWVEEDLRVAADRIQALAGITIGPLGERLDASIRGQILERLAMRALTPGEVVVRAGEPMPGLLLVGAGQLEVVEGDGVVGVVASGEFLFPTEVLGGGNAPKGARAGSGGALILFGDRMVAQELLVTCPPLLEVFAGM